MNWYDTLILTIFLLSLSVYWSFRKSVSYFKKNGIPYVKPNFLFGNIVDVLLRRKSTVQVYTQLYNQLHPHKFGGIYLMKNPAILLRDPELIKTVLIKDFNYFHDRSIPSFKEFEPLSHNLFTLQDITVDVIAAQSFVSFAAGFESSSTTIAHAMLELAQNECIQNKVREEIESVLNESNGQLTYEALKQMTYLEMIVAETLRKHPAGGFLHRKCTRTYKVPDTDVIIPSETIVIVSTYGIHWDEQYYDNPHEFRPERFTEEEKSKRPNHSYLPFGHGPRVCIGERFTNMLVKVGLIYLLKNFFYRLSPKTKFPLQFDSAFALQIVRGGIWLQREKLR